MASCPEISKENVYFLRSFLLLIEGGLYIAKLILVRECNNSESDLDELLKRNESKLKHLFHGKQYKKLFPDIGSVDINSWDLQLTIGVLINVFGRSIGLQEKQNLRLLRDLRNDIYMHCSSASLDEMKFEDVKNELDEIITTLASTFDETVKGKCSKYFDRFITGQLDGVRPSLKTLNGFSQSCQKHFKVGVKTELTVGGPSEYWISLCEETLVTILNHAESMASEDGGFQEVQENVKKMLAYLEDNKDVVFKGSKRECIMLCFECEDYERFLHFLEDVESEEYMSNLRSLSDSIVRFFKPKGSISISSRVTTESLQSVLIAILKTVSIQEEQQIQTIEISSEDTGNDMREMTTRHTKDTPKTNVISQKPLVVDLESSSGEGLIYLLKSFQERQFSDSLKNVASSLSNYHGMNVTLKASINVGDVFEALGETVSRDVKIGRTTRNVDKPSFMKTVMPSASDEEKIFTIGRIRLIKSVNYLRRYFHNPSIEYLRQTLPFTDTDDAYIMKGFSIENCIDRILAKILTGLKELQKSFLETKCSDTCIQYIKNYVNRQTVSEKDIKDLSALEGSMTGKCQRPNGVKPLIKFTCSERCLLLKSTTNPDGISAYLLSKIIISPQEFSEIIEKVEIETKTAALLNKVEKCSQKHLEELCLALKQHGSGDVADAIMKDKQLEPKWDRLQKSNNVFRTLQDESNKLQLLRNRLPIGDRFIGLDTGTGFKFSEKLLKASVEYEKDTLKPENEFRTVQDESIKSYLLRNRIPTGDPFVGLDTGTGLKFSQRSDDLDAAGKIESEKPLEASVEYEKDTLKSEDEFRTLQDEIKKIHLLRNRLPVGDPFIGLDMGTGFKFSQRSDDLDAVGKIKSEKPLKASVEYEKDTLKSEDELGTLQDQSKKLHLHRNRQPTGDPFIGIDMGTGFKFSQRSDDSDAVCKIKREKPLKATVEYEKDTSKPENEFGTLQDESIKSYLLRNRIPTGDPFIGLDMGIGLKFSQRSDDLDPFGKIKREKPLKASVEYEKNTLKSGETHEYHSYPVTPIKTTRTQFETKKVSTFDSDVKPRYYGKPGAEISKKVNEDDKQPGQVRYQTKMEKEN